MIFSVILHEVLSGSTDVINCIDDMKEIFSSYNHLKTIEILV